MFQKAKDKTGEALALRHLAKVSLLMGEYEYMKPDLTWSDYFKIARTLYIESMRIRRIVARREQNQEVAIADLKLDFGRLCWLWGRKCERAGRNTGNSRMLEEAERLYKEAIGVTEEGIELFEKYNVLRGLAKAYGNLGNAYKELARFHYRVGQDDMFFDTLKTTERNYTVSLKIAEQIGKVDETAHAKWGLAETYELYFERHRDEFYRVKALILATESNQLYGRMATPGDFEATRVLKERLESM
jgi:tetratricopeptide (TPR) repeat protein